MYNAQELSKRIKDYAKKRNILIRDMLAHYGLNVNTINRISDKNGLSAFSLAKIADYLDCSVDYLLGRTDIAERNLTSAEAIVTANSKENVLLLNFRNMNTAGQDYILQTIDMAKDKYKKCDSVSDGESIG